MSTEIEIVPHGALVSKRPLHNGEQIVARFPNGYGASIVRFTFGLDGIAGLRGPGSYGGDQGLWELGVVTFKSEGPFDAALTYSTPITDDVIGWLTEEDVLQICEQIAALPSVMP